MIGRTEDTRVGEQNEQDQCGQSRVWNAIEAKVRASSKFLYNLFHLIAPATFRLPAISAMMAGKARQSEAKHERHGLSIYW